MLANNMDTLIIILLISSFLLNVLLGYFLISFRTGAARLKDIIGDIRKHSMPRRIHFGFVGKPLVKISTELNLLMDEFQNILEKKKRLELSQKQLVSNISHDIRTPLTSLMGYIEVLKEQKLNDSKRREYLDIVYMKACSIHRMIEDFFELAKLEAEDKVLELEQVNLNDIVQETLASFYGDFVLKHITPDIDLPENPVLVLGESKAIERVLSNLINNALKYGGDGGTIGISVYEEEKKGWISVIDGGKGICESELPYVFDRLYTADASRSAHERGAGLGLAIAKQLVEKQNGGITAQSSPGVKTIFSFYLNKSKSAI